MNKQIAIDDYFITVRMEQMDKRKWWWKVEDRFRTSRPSPYSQYGFVESKKEAIKQIVIAVNDRLNLTKEQSND